MRVYYKVYWRHEELGSGQSQASTYEEAMEQYTSFIKDDGCNHVYVEMIIIGTIVDWKEKK